ncbi:MAG: hypothetical protein ACLFR1_14165 [Spirochaetia bacterium]
MDSNNHILCFELKEAIQWMQQNLIDWKPLLKGESTVTLSNIPATHADGKKLLNAARSVLAKLGKRNAQAIELGEIRTVKQHIEETPVSEAGIVLPKAAKDTDTAEYIRDIITAVGGTPHPSGDTGVNKDELEEFSAASSAFLAWKAKGALPDGVESTDIMPFGSRTDRLFSILTAIEAKVDQNFTQSHLVALDPGIFQRHPNPLLKKRKL